VFPSRTLTARLLHAAHQERRYGQEFDLILPVATLMRTLGKTISPEGLNLNAHLKNHGYYTAAMGKTYHSSSGGLKTVYASEWDQYPPTRRGQSAGRAPRKYEGYHEQLEIDLQDEDLPDWHTVDFCIKQLKEKRNKPFFLACGLIKAPLTLGGSEENTMNPILLNRFNCLLIKKMILMIYQQLALRWLVLKKIMRSFFNLDDGKMQSSHTLQRFHTLT
jgi:hypothetical protein